MAQISFFSTNNIIYTVIVPSAFFIIILCFTYASYSGSDFLLTGSVINQVHKDLNSAPITDLQLTKGQCPLKFESLVLGEWAGSVEGCSSLVGTPHTNCHFYNIEKIPPVDIMNWRGSNFCVKRSKDFIYTSAECGSGYKRCSKQLCVASDEQCPLTGAKIGMNPNVEENSTVFTIDGAHYIQTFRTQNEDPLISVEFSYGGKPCLAQGYALENKDAYPLLKQRYNCGKYGLDGRTKTIDQIPEISLYNSNGLTWLFDRLENYEDTIKNNTVSLVTRQLMELSPSPICYKLEFPQVPTPVIELIILNQNAWVVLILVFELLLLMIAGIFGCMYATRKNTETIFEFFSMFNLVTVSIIVATSVIWVSILYYSGRSGLEQLDGMKYQFTELPGYRCFPDPAVTQAFVDINQEIGTVPESLELATSYILYIALLRLLLVFSSFWWRKHVA